MVALKVEPALTQETFSDLVNSHHQSFNALHMDKALTFLERQASAPKSDVEALRTQWDKWKDYQREIDPRGRDFAGPYAQNMIWASRDKRLSNLESQCGIVEPSALEGKSFEHSEKPKLAS